MIICHKNRLAMQCTPMASFIAFAVQRADMSSPLIGMGDGCTHVVARLRGQNETTIHHRTRQFWQRCCAYLVLLASIPTRRMAQAAHYASGAVRPLRVSFRVWAD